MLFFRNNIALSSFLVCARTVLRCSGNKFCAGLINSRGLREPAELWAWGGHGLILLARVGVRQARNQPGTPGGAKSFLRGAQIFWTVSNSFKLCPTNFSRGVENFSRRASPPLVTGLGWDKKLFVLVTERWPNECESDMSKKVNAIESLWHKGVAQWFPNFFWSRTIYGSRSANTYHLVPRKVNVSNTRTDTNATWRRWLWQSIMAIFRNQHGV